jgi:hypothetical protein
MKIVFQKNIKGFKKVNRKYEYLYGNLSIYVLPSPYTTISQSVFPLDGVLEIFGLNETYTTFS